MTKKEFYEFVLEAYRPAEALMRMTPADKLDWRPESNFMSLGQVICHLSEGITQELQCLTTGQWPSPEQMAELMKLENIPACTVEEALQKLEADKSALGAFLDSLSEEDFSQKAVSTPWGMQGKMERMSLTFREHFTNHKMQLFTYLKLLGLPVNTGTLYSGESME